MDFANLVFEQKSFDGVFVMDVHTHCGGDPKCQIKGYDADGLVATMDRMGVDVACVSGIPALYSDWKKGNDEAAEVCAQYPGRFLAYAVANPYYDDCDLEPYFRYDMGFVGLKIHGYAQGEIPENDPRFFRFYEFANKHKMPVLVHAWCPWEVDRMSEMAGKYPDMKVILGHSGFTVARPNAIEACKKRDNIYLDTTISTACDGMIESLVDLVGDDRILYGSDLPFFSCIHNLGKIAMSKLSDTTKEKILGLNAKKLFEL